MRDLITSTATKGFLGTITSLTLSQWSEVAGLVAGFLTAGYVAYKWIRDARERTCDKVACPRRHLPD